MSGFKIVENNRVRKKVTMNQSSRKIRGEKIIRGEKY